MSIALVLKTAKGGFGEIRASGKSVRSNSGVALMIDLDAIKITPRHEEVLRLLAKGCSKRKSPGTSISAHGPANSIGGHSS
jgi:hypothetical protein